MAGDAGGAGRRRSPAVAADHVRRRARGRERRRGAVVRLGGRGLLQPVRLLARRVQRADDVDLGRDPRQRPHRRSSARSWTRSRCAAAIPIRATATSSIPTRSTCACSRWQDRPFTILAGRIPPVFGAFARRDYGEVNPLIGLPLAYGYSTTMRPEPPPSRRELLLNRGGGWAVRYPRATATTGPQGAAAGLGAALGHRRLGAVGRRQARGRRRRHDRHAVVAAHRRRQRRQADLRPRRRQAVGQLQRRRVGRERRVRLESGRRHRLRQRRLAARAGAIETHRQQALGLDAEYSLGHVLVRGEVVASRWDVPFLNGDPTLALDALGSSIETRIALTPRWSLAVRGDRLGFSRVDPCRTATSGPGTRRCVARRGRGRLPGAPQRPPQGRLPVQLARRRPRALDRHGRRAAPLLVLMTTRPPRRPSFVVVALALAAASLGLVHAAAPRGASPPARSAAR